MLTVVVGRAVFGAGITIGEAWQRLRGRLWALIGFTVLRGARRGVLIAVVVVASSSGSAFAANGVAAVGRRRSARSLAIAGGLIYLWTMLTFAPSIIVLERLGIVAAIKRSFKLVKEDFWRVFGIRLLGMIVAELIAGAVAVPFSVGGQILLMSASSTTAALIALVAADDRRRDRPDHHRTVHRRRGGAAVHRSPHPRRGVRPGAADRRRVRARRAARFHRQPVADPPATLTCRP